MARDGISFDQVAAAADTLVGNNQQPTIRAVRDMLGTGSPNTIHKHLTAWRAARPQTTAAAPELPAAILAAIMGEIERAASAARAEVEGKLVQAQAEAAELAAAGESLEQERDERAGVVAILTTERDQATATAAERLAEIERNTHEIERERQATEAARVELATARLRAESTAEKLAEQGKEIERLRAALKVCGQARQEAERQAAALTEKAEAGAARAVAAEQRETLMRTELAELRQAHERARDAATEANTLAAERQRQIDALTAAQRAGTTTTEAAPKPEKPKRGQKSE